MPINKEEEKNILDKESKKERFLKESSNAFGTDKMNQETIQALEDIENGNLYGGFSSVEELTEDLIN